MHCGLRQHRRDPHIELSNDAGAALHHRTNRLQGSDLRDRSDGGDRQAVHGGAGRLHRALSKDQGGDQVEAEQLLQADTVSDQPGGDEAVSLAADLHEARDQQLPEQDQAAQLLREGGHLRHTGNHRNQFGLLSR